MRGGGRVRLSVAESIGCGIDSRADDKDTVIQVANSLCICTLLDYASKISNERIIRFSCLVSPTSEALVNKTFPMLLFICQVCRLLAVLLGRIFHSVA